MLIFNILDYLSTFVFAFNGAKAHLNYGNCLFRAVLFGVMTAVRGGTIRDTLIGAPIFWTKKPLYIITSIFFAIVSLYYYGKLPGLTKLVKN